MREIESDRPWGRPEPGSFEEGKLKQLDRLIVLDKTVTAAIDFANQEETPGEQDWNNAVDFTRKILRRSIYSTMMDLLEYGDVDAYITTKQTIDAVPYVTPGQASEYFLGEDPRRTVEEVTVFVSELRSIDYANGYVDPRYKFRQE